MAQFEGRSMELRIGYYPVLDAALALRQAFESIRFQPYNPAMEAIAERFSPADRDATEVLGEGTGGWLQVIGALLERDAEGLLGLEEGLLRLEDAAEPTKARLAQVLRTGIAPEAARRARSLLEATAAIHLGIQAAGVWDYVLGLSDRVFRARSGELVFRTKPEMRVREADLERIVLTPSLVATRRLTFWRNAKTALFYVSSGLAPTPEEPSDSLLLSALAVGDRTRLRMLRHLAEQPCSNLEMAEFLGMNPSTASRHFKLLKDAGFVEVREDAGRTECELAPRALEAALGAIVAFIKGGGR
jgi:DNA-binding transcriptional ArsR family regulator